MKSKVANGLNAKMSRIGLLSLVTVMCVSLSAGSALAADYKVWKLKDGKAGEPVEVMKSDRGDLATKLLIKDKDFKGFLSEFKSSPTDMVAGMRKALVSDSANFKANRDAIVEGLKAAMADAEMGSLTVKDAMKKLIDALAKIDSVKDLENTDGAHEMFMSLLELSGKKSEILAALGLTDEKKEEVAGPAAPATPAAPALPTTPVVAQPGEVDDSFLQAKAQEQCDKYNARKQKQDDEINNLYNEIANQFASQRRKPRKSEEVASVDNNALFGQLGRLFGNNDEQPAIPPAAAPAQVAQQQQPEQPQDNSVLDEPVQPLQQQQAALPLTPVTPPSSGQVQQFTLQPVTNFGDKEKAALASSIADSKALAGYQLPVTGQINPAIAVNMLRDASAQTAAQIEDLQTSQDSMQARIDTLRKEQKRLQGLPPGAEEEGTKLQQAYAEAKRNSDSMLPQLQQQLSQVQQAAQNGDPTAQLQVQRINADISKLTADTNSAKGSLEAHNANMTALSKKGAAQAAELEDVISGLETQLGQVKAPLKLLTERQNKINTLIQENQQLAMGGQGGSTINAQRIGGVSTNRGRGFGAAVNPPVANTGRGGQRQRF